MNRGREREGEGEGETERACCSSVFSSFATEKKAKNNPFSPCLAPRSPPANEFSFAGFRSKKTMVVVDAPGGSLGSGLTRLGAVDFSAMFTVSANWNSLCVPMKRGRLKEKTKEQSVAVIHRSMASKNKKRSSFFIFSSLSPSQVEASRLIGGVEANCIAIHPSRPVIAVVS